MKEGYRKVTICSNREIATDIYEMKVKGSGILGDPGQFYMLKGWLGLDPFFYLDLLVYVIFQMTKLLFFI